LNICFLRPQNFDQLLYVFTLLGEYLSLFLDFFQLFLTDLTQKTLHKLILSIWISCSIACWLPAQQLQESIFNQFTRQEGLPSNHIQNIFQDHQGFLWLATDNGLTKFDGSYFKNYSSKDFGPGLSSNVTSVFEVEDGILWLIIDQQKLVEYKMDCDCFENLENRFEFKISAIQKGLYRIKKYENIIYLIGDSLLKFSDRKTLLNVFNFHSFVVDLIPLNKDTALTAEFDHSIYLMNSDSTIVDLKTDQFWRITNLTTKLPGNELLQDSQGRYWSASWSNGLLELFPESSKASKLIPLKQHAKQRDTELNCLAEDLRGNIWIGSNNFGLHCLIQETEGIIHFGSKNKFPVDAHVRDIAMDNDGRVWIGTKEHGLYLMSPVQNQCSNISFGKNQADLQVLCFFELTPKKYLVGTNKGIWKWNGKNDFRKANGNSDSQKSIHCIYKNYKGELLVGASDGLYEYQEQGEKIIEYTVVPNGDPSSVLDINNLKNTKILQLNDYIIDRSGSSAKDKFKINLQIHY